MPKVLVDVASRPPVGRACALPLSMAVHVVMVGAILLAQALSPVDFPKINPPPIVGIPVPVDPGPPPPPCGDPARPRIRGTTLLRPVQRRFGVAPVEETPRWAPFASQPISPEDVGVGLGPVCEGCSPDGADDGVPGGVPGASGTGEAPSKPVPVGGDVRPPTKLRHVNAAYPEIARAARVQGKVVLECVIGTDGRVTDIRVIRGQPLLDAAAVAAVQQWVYAPTRLNGRAVAVLMTVTIDFRISR